MTMKRTLCLLCCIWFLLLPATFTLAEGENAAIVQVYLDPTDTDLLQVRVEATNNDGASRTVTADSLQEAAIGTGHIPLVSVSNLGDDGFTGMRYVFVLDHAMPIEQHRVDEMEKGMERWINALTEQSYAAILVNEADETKDLTSGFTNRRDELKDALSEYGGASQHGSSKSQLYQSIQSAIRLLAQKNSKMPDDSCIIVFSNGVDTYHTIITAEDISRQLSEYNIPLYVVGFAYTGVKPTLSGLVNLARSSGGWSEDASPSNDANTVDEAFDKIRKRISGGSKLTFDCSDGFVFSGPTLVTLRFDFLPVPIKRSADLYKAKDSATPAPKSSAESDTAESAAANSGQSEPSKLSIDNKRIYPIIIIAGGVIGLLAIISSIAKKNRKRASMEQRPKVPVEPSSSDSQTFVDRPIASVSEDDRTVALRSERNKTDAFARDVAMTDLRRYTPPLAQAAINTMTISYRLPKEDKAEKTFINPSVIELGRVVDDDHLCIPWKMISRKHLRIECIGQRVYIENISQNLSEKGGRNPVYLDDRVIPEGKTEVNNGCRLTLGNVPVWISWTITTQNDPDKTVRKSTDTSDETVRPLLLQITYVTQNDEEKRLDFLLTNEATIGRSRQDSICINDPQMSRHHIKLTRIEGTRTVTLQNTSQDLPDVGKNPVFIDGDKMNDQVELTDTMKITAANTKLVIHKLH